MLSSVDGRIPMERTVSSKCPQAIHYVLAECGAYPENLLETMLKNFGLMSLA